MPNYDYIYSHSKKSIPDFNRYTKREYYDELNKSTKNWSSEYSI
jgi:uncharacterized short protein YbdD (DUF466 family)